MAQTLEAIDAGRFPVEKIDQLVATIKGKVPEKSKPSFLRRNLEAIRNFFYVPSNPHDY